ncbi:uncharacterized protein LOC101900989 [Musca domestica]|uniref:Uncharacterized protein LOC101900989 n=1 Tax=Musca domestica TaxID=7370 RepID=A0A9J7D1S8_MUSDO|nr:uncharacterized protein LOC101900989 [Musca domestica]
MSSLKDSLNEEHLKLVESINNRVGSIYKQLCEFEECIDPNTSDDYGDAHSKIMDLLECLDDIQEAAQMIRPYNLTLRSQQEALNEQIKCLEQSVQVLRLETGKMNKSQDGMED